MKADIRAAIERVRQAGLTDYPEVAALCDFAERHAKPAPADTPELVEVVAYQFERWANRFVEWQAKPKGLQGDAGGEPNPEEGARDILSALRAAGAMVGPGQVVVPATQETPAAAYRRGYRDAVQRACAVGDMRP